MSAKKGSKPVKISDKQRKINPKSLLNLNQFEKGVSGNPDGRPVKNGRLRDALKQHGQKEYIKSVYIPPPKKNIMDAFDDDFFGTGEEGKWEEIPTGRTISEELMQMIWEKALNGEWNYLSLLLHLDVVQPK
jgi:hypothetical protein